MSWNLEAEPTEGNYQEDRISSTTELWSSDTLIWSLSLPWQYVYNNWTIL